MKLIDLLVRELPRRGGWPEKCHGAGINGQWSWMMPPWGCSPMAFRVFSHEVVTREQYEAALAESEKITWDGAGFPPVGIECESLHCFAGSEWQRIIVKWSDGNQFLYEWVREGHPVHHLLGYVEQHRFRPMHTEANRKRHESLYALEQLDIDSDITIRVLDAIAAGKIPHITLK